MITKFKIFEGSYFHTQGQIDDILQKINDEGYSSLDDSEEAILLNFSKDDANIHEILVKVNTAAKKMRNFVNEIEKLSKTDPKKAKERYMKEWVGLNTTFKNYEMTLKYLYKLDDSQDIIRYQDENGLTLRDEEMYEKVSERKPAKEGLEKSHLPKEMKEKIYPYINSESYYSNKKVMELTKPKVKGKSFDGVSLGADKDGFFVYTHRSRTHSYDEPNKIPINKIAFVKSTG